MSFRVGDYVKFKGTADIYKINYKYVNRDLPRNPWMYILVEVTTGKPHQFRAYTVHREFMKITNIDKVLYL